MVLLAGTIRHSPLSAAIERSILDLPLGDGRTVLEVWCDAAEQVAAHLPRGRLSVRVLVDPSSATPSRPSGFSRLDVEFERDPHDFRGTAGLLADICVAGQGAGTMLVANAGQPPTRSLVDTVTALAATGADVALHACRRGTPTGLFVVRCDALSLVPGVGYFDLKEQALPRIAREKKVRVVFLDHALSEPIRDLAGYLRVLRQFSELRAGRGGSAASPFAEVWAPSFSLVEPGAHVAPDARILDSVVLAGGSVASGATVVRSLVGPGGVVRPRARVYGRIVRRTGRRHSRWFGRGDGR